jgi:hypothetical protein
MAKSFLQDPNRLAYPRGIRNNNPGNLRRSANDWVGKVPYAVSTDTSFEQFYELRYGIRAMMRDIYSDINKGNNTIAGLISEYAPASDNNNTVAYIQAVVNALGIAPHVQLEITDQLLISLSKVIALKENGAIAAQMITDRDYQDALDILGKPVKKKAQAA